MQAQLKLALRPVGEGLAHVASLELVPVGETVSESPVEAVPVEALHDAVVADAQLSVDEDLVVEGEVDGTLAGPDLVGLRDVVAATPVDVIASGGVGSLDDLRALTAIEAEGRRLAGAITGKAIYERRFTAAEGVAVLGAAREGEGA